MNPNSAFRFEGKMNFDFHAPRAERVQVHSALRHIEQAELVRRFDETELEYWFKHVLVQDSAYSTLMKQQRKALHRLVAEVLEQQYADNLDEIAATLAQHYAQAGDDEKFSFYAECAGNAAARVFAFAEAYELYRSALSVLSQLPDKADRRRQQADLVAKIVSVSLRSRGPEASLELLMAAERAMQELPPGPQDRERMARLHFWIGDAYSHLNQQPKAIAYIEQVLAAAKQGVTDNTLLAIPLNVIGRALAAQGKFAEAEPLLAQAAPLLETSANWYEWVLAVGFLGFVRAAQGRTDDALLETTRAFKRANELGIPTGIGDSHVFACFIYLQRGEYDQMLVHSNAALAAATPSNDQLAIFLAYGIRAWAHTHLAQFERAEADFQRAWEMAALFGGHVFNIDMFQAAFAELALRQGDAEAARARAMQAVETSRAVGSVFSEGIARRVLMQVLPTPRAEEQFAACVRLFESGNAQLELARTHRTWGQVLFAYGERNTARKHFDQATILFESAGLTHEVHQTRATAETPGKET